MCAEKKEVRTMQGMRKKIISIVQKKADTKKQKIDASIVSRVASITLDEVIKILNRKY